MGQLDPKLMEIARSMARRIARRCPRSVAAEDLEQAAVLGLLDALGRHPDGEGPSWQWYLRCRMRGAILDELRAQDWVGRRRGGRVQPRVVHLDDVNVLWSETLPTAGESPEDVAMRTLDAAKAWSTPLGPRDARIMRACYADGVKHRDIGVGESISEARVSQRVARSLAGMRSHLTGEPAPSFVPRATALALWKRQTELEPETVNLQGGSCPTRTASGDESLPP